MGQAPWTTPRSRRLAMLLGCTSAVLALLLPGAPESSASTAAAWARQLATDTQRLATARDDLAETRADLRATRRQHRRLRVRIEHRLVVVYMANGSVDPIARVAAGGSMRDVGRSLDALDRVAVHEAHEIRRWVKLGERRDRLEQRRKRLVRAVAAAEHAVARGRERLDAARAAAEAARRQAERMAQRRESPLLPRVGHPETMVVVTAEAAEAVPASDSVGYVEHGVASVYSDSFTGERTANGERYDPHAFTAAHPSLPFGTWVEVAGPNGTVAVRINDRGPFVGGRVIDLSRAAAASISLGGLAQVTLTVRA